MKQEKSGIREKLRKKTMRSLQPKLTLPVLLAVGATFFLILLFCIVYYQNAYKEQEIGNQREQMDQVINSLATVQSTVENVSKQIAVSEVVQGTIRTPIKPSAEYFVAEDNVQNALGTYTFIMDYIQEVLIYTRDGDSYSSFLFRDKFIPEREPWYQKFKERGEARGYSDIHSATVSQNGRVRNVISYVMTYYSLSNYHEELGDLIISLDYASLEKMATMDMSLLKGYAVYDMHGESLIDKGNLDLSYNEINQIDDREYTDNQGNTYLISRELDGGWMMVVELSGEMMQRQILSMELLIIFAFIILAVVIVGALSYNIRKVVEPINRLSEAAEQFGNGNFDVSVDVHTGDEVEVLANAFNEMVRDVQHYTEMSVEHEKAIRRSQVDQLLLQINPHFIYNTLNSIVYMARTDGNKDIEEFVNAFVSLLQNTLRVEKEVYTSLGEELKNVENYLILQKYRYMDKFQEDIDCPEELKHYLVPKVILQPIVENAIFHGLAPEEGPGKLKIVVQKEENALCILVEDDGIGMTEETIAQLFEQENKSSDGMRKIGVANVYRRIKQICGEEYGFTIDSELGKGTKITIRLPLNEQEERQWQI